MSYLGVKWLKLTTGHCCVTSTSRHVRNTVNLLIFDGFKVTQWHHCNCILYRLRYLFSYSISCSATTKGNLTREGNQTPSHKDDSTKPQGREKNILHISVRSILVSLLHKDCVFKKRATGENKHLWKTFVRGWWIFSGHIQHKWYTYIMKFFNILIGSGCFMFHALLIIF